MNKKRKQTPGSKAFGFILFFVGFLFLIWNEFKIVGFNKICTSAILKIKPVDIYKLDPNNDGQLIYISGPIHTNESLTQSEYGISIPAVILKRRVQMLQWIEVMGHTSEDITDASMQFDTSYSYHTDWRDKLVDSSKFLNPVGHQNPKYFPLKSETTINNVVCVGIYCLTDDFKQKFNHFTLVTSDERPDRRDIKMHAGLYYHTADIWNPVVGDTRIQFSYAGNFGDVVSLIGTQEGSMVTGRDLLLLEHGKISPDEMIYNRHNKYIWIHRIFRFVCWIMLYISSFYLNTFIMIMKTRYHKSTNFFTMDGWLSVNFSVSSLLTVATISLVWIHFSPWMSTSIWVIALCPLIISSYFRETSHYTDDYMQLR